MNGVSTLALVGAVGGAGTTRTAVELASVGAHGGRDVVVLDAAYPTQGLAEYVPGRIVTDLTRLVTEDRDTPLEAGTVERTDVEPGSVGLVPAKAPFERLARAMTVESARVLEDRISEAANEFDHVIVDTPPVASNQAVAAVTEAARVVAVTPASQHGCDALQRLRGRLSDVGASHDYTISTSGSVPAADVGLPETEPRVASAPTSIPITTDFGEAAVTAFETVFETRLPLERRERSIFDRVR